MPAIAGRTRKQLRQSVGLAAGVVEISSASSQGLVSTIVDNTLRGGTDDHIGKWIVATSGDNAGSISRVSAYATGTTTLTVVPSFGAVTPSAMTYEMWNEGFRPSRIHDLINQAILEVTGRAFAPQESLALHGDGRQRRFDVPSAFKMLDGIWERRSVESVQIHAATSDWDEATVANVTRTLDTKHYKFGGGSVRMVVAAGAAAGLVLASKAISSLDLGGYDYVEFWIESTVATTAGDLQLLLDDTALSVSPIETLNVPALVANTPTYVRVALATPALDSAIISVGLKYTVDIGAVTIWINDVKAVLDSTANWVRMDKNNWWVEEQAQDIVMQFPASDRLLKLTGGNNPRLLTADGDVNQVDDEFVIARATELTLLSASGGPATDPDALRSLASYWGQKAAVAKRGLPMLVGARIVS